MRLALLWSLVAFLTAAQVLLLATARLVVTTIGILLGHSPNFQTRSHQGSQEALGAVPGGYVSIYLEFEVTLDAPQKNMAIKGMPSATRAPVVFPYLPCNHTGMAIR